MVPVIYRGPHAAVVVEETGDVAQRGGPAIDVPEHVAQRLLAQDTWVKGKPPKPETPKQEKE